MRYVLIEECGGSSCSYGFDSKEMAMEFVTRHVDAAEAVEVCLKLSERGWCAVGEVSYCLIERKGDGAVGERQ